VDLQRRCYPHIRPWTREQFESQLRVFPEGQIGIEYGGKLAATSSALIIDSNDAGEQHTLEQISDAGLIRNHDPEGDSLYGIDIAVTPEFRGLRLARRIYERRKALVRDRNLRRILIAGRMPGYGRRAHAMSAQESVRRVLAREIRDPVIATQVSNGFTIRSLIPGYLPSDKESGGYAVYMEWLNPYYSPPGTRQFLSGRVRVAAVQYSMRAIRSFEEFEKQCEFFVDTAGEYRADFVLFPELLTNQLLSLVPAERPDLSARRLSEFTTPYVDSFRRMAVKYYVNIVAGSHLQVEDDRLYNVAYLFRRDGTTATQQKLHITPSEAKWWGVSPGRHLEVLDTDRGRIAILICYDIEFPELSRIAVSQGANVLFVPYNTDIRPAHLRVRYCAQARCIENSVYCVLAGAVGNLPFVEGADIHYGQSSILTPSDISFARDGVEAEATPNVETMLVHDLDIGLVRRMRRLGAVRTWLDRRSDLYGVSYRRPGAEAHELI